MDRFVCIIMCFAICLSFNTTFAASEENNAYDVFVNEGKIVKEADLNLFGINNEWGSFASVVANHSLNEVLTEQTMSSFVSTVKNQGLPLSLNRMAGFTSQYMNWKSAIGDYENRNPTVGHKSVGPVEWIKAILAADENAEFVWVFNCVEESPQDHADLVEFLTGDPLNDANGGVNWAQLRVDYGLEEPVKVLAWEIGNELDLITKNPQSFDESDFNPRNFTAEEFDVNWYKDYVIDTISAVKAVNPDAKFAIMGVTNPHDTTETWAQWHNTLFSDAYIRENVDYVTLHTYYIPTRRQNEIGNYSMIQQYAQKIVSDIKALGKEDISIFASEQSLWTTSHNVSNSLFGVLHTADYYNRILQNKDFSLACYHSMSSGYWAVIKNGSGSAKYITGIGELIKLFADSLGDNQLEVKVDYKYEEEPFESDTFSVSATQRDEFVNLIIVNKSETATRSINTYFSDNQYRLIGKKILTGESMSSYITPNDRPIYTIDLEADDTGYFCGYDVPPKSVVVLKLQRAAQNEDMTAICSPSNNQSGVSVDEEITLDFSESLDMNTVDNDSIRLEKSNGEPVEYDIDVIGENSIKINTFENLKHDANYKIILSENLRSISGKKVREEHRVFKFDTQLPLIFQDDFEGTALSEVWSCNNSSYTVSNGYLTIGGPSSTTVTLNNVPIEDFVFETGIRPVSFGTSSGLYFTFSDGTNRDRFFIREKTLLHVVNNENNENVERASMRYAAIVGLQEHLTDNSLILNNEYNIKIESKKGVVRFYIKPQGCDEYFKLGSSSLAKSGGTKTLSISKNNAVVGINSIKIYSNISPTVENGNGKIIFSDKFEENQLKSDWVYTGTSGSNLTFSDGYAITPANVLKRLSLPELALGDFVMTTRIYPISFGDYADLKFILVGSDTEEFRIKARGVMYVKDGAELYSSNYESNSHFAKFLDNGMLKTGVGYDLMICVRDFTVKFFIKEVDSATYFFVGAFDNLAQDVGKHFAISSNNTQAMIDNIDIKTFDDAALANSGIDIQGELSLLFSNEMNADTITKDKFKVYVGKKEVNDWEIVKKSDVRWNIKFDDLMERNTVYTVKITGEVLDKNGLQASNNSEISFLTGGLVGYDVLVDEGFENNVIPASFKMLTTGQDAFFVSEGRLKKNDGKRAIMQINDGNQAQKFTDVVFETRLIFKDTYVKSGANSMQPVRITFYNPGDKSKSVSIWIRGKQVLLLVDGIQKLSKYYSDFELLHDILDEDGSVCANRPMDIRIIYLHDNVKLYLKGGDNERYVCVFDSESDDYLIGDSIGQKTFELGMDWNANVELESLSIQNKKTIESYFYDFTSNKRIDNLLGVSEGVRITHNLIDGEQSKYELTVVSAVFSKEKLVSCEVDVLSEKHPFAEKVFPLMSGEAVKVFYLDDLISINPVLNVKILK